MKYILTDLVTGETATVNEGEVRRIVTKRFSQERADALISGEIDEVQTPYVRINREA